MSTFETYLFGIKRRPIVESSSLFGAAILNSIYSITLLLKIMHSVMTFGK
jgi:hypothetical protein